MRVDRQGEADIFSLGMVFMFLLLPVTDKGHPSMEFVKLALIASVTPPWNYIPPIAAQYAKSAVLEGVWTLVSDMICRTIREPRPSIDQVVDRLEPLRHCVEFLEGESQALVAPFPVGQPPVWPHA